LRALPREAVDAEQARQSEQCGDVRPQRLELVYRAEPDVDELRTVVVVLDGELRPIEAQGCEQRLSLVVRLRGGQRLDHASEDDPLVVALERNRHDSSQGLEPDLGGL